MGWKRRLPEYFVCWRPQTSRWGNLWKNVFTVARQTSADSPANRAKCTLLPLIGQAYDE